MKKLTLNLNTVPYLYSQTYTDQIDNYLLVHNYQTKETIELLNLEAAFLFKLVDNKKNLQQILKLAQKKDPTFNKKQLLQIFQQFLDHNLITLKKSPRLKIQTKKPNVLGVWLHITNQCNLRCKYCYVHKTEEKMSDQTGCTAIKNILRDAKKHGIKRIVIKFSGGECLLEFAKVKKFHQLAVKLGEKANIAIESVIMTNGTLLTPKIVKEIKDNHFRLAISLDGPKEQNDQQRIFRNGKGSFNRVEQGIKRIQQAQIPFNVSVTITKNNVEHIPEFTKYLIDNQIQFAFNFYRDNQNSAEEITSSNQKLIKYLKKAYQYIADHPPRYSVINGLLDRVSFRTPHLVTCGMGRNYIVVRHDGQLVACQMTLEESIGSIHDPDLIKSMQKGNFIKPRGMTVENRQQCQDCPWRYYCCGGCPLLTFSQHKRYDLSSSYCQVYQKLIPQAFKIEAKRIINHYLDKS